MGVLRRIFWYFAGLDIEVLEKRESAPPPDPRTEEEILEDQIIEWIGIWLTSDEYAGEWRHQHEELRNPTRKLYLHYWGRDRGSILFIYLNNEKLSRRITKSERLGEAVIYRLMKMGAEINRKEPIVWKYYPEIADLQRQREIDKQLARENALRNTLRLIVDQELQLGNQHEER